MYSFRCRGCEKKFFHKIKKGDYVVFVMGEIDVRCHLCKKINNNNLEEVLTKLTHNYISKIVEYQEQYGFIPVIFSVLPPIKTIKHAQLPTFGPWKKE